MNICLCTKDDSYRIRKNFESYEELLKWTQEQIEEQSNIEPGDKVEIIDELKMFAALPDDFFVKMFWYCDEIEDVEQIVEITRFYKYNPMQPYEGIKGMVICEYDNKYLIRIPFIGSSHSHDYIVIGKKGVKKVNA